MNLKPCYKAELETEAYILRAKVNRHFESARRMKVLHTSHPQTSNMFLRANGTHVILAYNVEYYAQ